MSHKLKANETVYVPRTRLALGVEAPMAFHRTTVLETKDGGRSVKVSLPDGTPSAWIGSSAVHRNIGVYVVRFGDFQSELSLLDPLAESMFQYLRVLLSDSYVRSVGVRSKAEFRRFWETDHAAFSHLVLIGHGSPNSLTCGIDGPVSGPDFAALLEVPGLQPKLILSLACETGRGGFAKPVSASSACQAFVAPYQNVHGGVASQFSQTLLSHLLLEGRTASVAFNRSRKGVPLGASFRQWAHGSLVRGGS